MSPYALYNCKSRIPPFAGDHDVAVKAKLGAPCRVEVTKVGGEEALSKRALLPPLTIDGGQQVVWVG